MLQDAGLPLDDIAGVLSAETKAEWKAIATERLGLRGGLIGLGLAIATLLLSSLMWNSRDAPVGAQYLPQLISAPWHYIWLLLVPAITGLIALLTARLTVLSVLGRMP